MSSVGITGPEASEQFDGIFSLRNDSFDFSLPPDINSLNAIDSPFNTPTLNPAIAGGNLDIGFFSQRFDNLFGFQNTLQPQPLTGLIVGVPSAIDHSRGITKDNKIVAFDAEVARQERIFGSPLSNDKLVSIADAIRQLAGQPSNFNTETIANIRTDLSLLEGFRQSIATVGEKSSNVVTRVAESIPDAKNILGTLSILGVAAIVIGFVVLRKT